MKRELKVFDLDSIDHSRITVEGLVRVAGKWIQDNQDKKDQYNICLLYTSPSPRDLSTARMPSSA